MYNTIISFHKLFERYFYYSRSFERHVSPYILNLDQHMSFEKKTLKGHQKQGLLSMNLRRSETMYRNL